MKYYCLLGMVLMFHSLFSQGLTFSGSVGSVIVSKDNYKTLGICNKSGILGEWVFRRNLRMESGIQLIGIKYLSLGNRFFMQNRLLQVPVSLRVPFCLNARTAFYLDMGGYFNSILKEISYDNEWKRPVATLPVKCFAVGYSFGLGIRTKLLERWNLMASLTTQRDLICRTDRSEDHRLFSNTLINAGLQYRFVR